MHATPDMIAFRQNCPPLLHLGQINPALTTRISGGAWGYTYNTDITWRTGVGLTSDARYLIYAMGNGSSAQTLAEALQLAGAYNAMELDVNQPYAHFVTYQYDEASISEGFALAAFPLLEEMTYSRHIYLKPNSRDFFYLTAR
jgi:hypothetical protein